MREININDVLREFIRMRHEILEENTLSCDTVDVCMLSEFYKELSHDVFIIYQYLTNYNKKLIECGVKL